MALITAGGAVAGAQNFMRDHPLFHTHYPVKGVPQIPSIREWRPGGNTSEYGEDSIEVHGRGIADRSGRLMVLFLASCSSRSGECLKPELRT